MVNSACLCITVKKACFETRCLTVVTVYHLNVLHNEIFQIWNIAEFYREGNHCNPTIRLFPLVCTTVVM